jgi:hypothetical protein
MATTPKPYEGAIIDLAKNLITDLLKESQKGIGDSPLEKIMHHVKYGGADATMASISALSAYAHAKAAERQADAIEALAKTANKLQIADQIETAGQAIVDERESKRDYLASTYSLPTHTLTLLWALRGMLVDASIKSLSKPDRFDPYRRVSTDEVAWTLRMSPEQFWDALPRHSDGAIDYSLLEAFEILHYGGTVSEPDQWIYGG